MYNFNINTAGFIIAGLFLLTWLTALLIWRFGRIEERWTASPRPAPVRPRAGAAARSGPVPVRWDRAGTAPALDKGGISRAVMPALACELRVLQRELGQLRQAARPARRVGRAATLAVYMLVDRLLGDAKQAQQFGRKDVAWLRCKVSIAGSC